MRTNPNGSYQKSSLTIVQIKDEIIEIPTLIILIKMSKIRKVLYENTKKRSNISVIQIKHPI